MINKLKLDLDSLEVASFATQAPDADAKGTVAANSEPVSLAITFTIVTGTLISKFACTISE